jgi:glycosyltransferase involved in cell wall biosynthesis
VKILMVVLHAKLIGGLETYSRDVALALRDMGHHLTVISALEASQQFKGWDNLPIRGLAPAAKTLFRLYMRGWQHYLALWFAANRIQTTYDCVFVMHPYAAYSARRAGIRNYVVWSYGIDVWGEWSKHLTDGLTRAGHLVTISQHTQSILQRHFPNREVSIISPIVDTHRFIPKSVSANISPSRLSLLTVGRLIKDEAYKGHEKIMRNLKTIQQRVGAAVEYWIAGDGDDRARLEQLATTYGVTAGVKFWGRIADENLVELYQDCTLFVMPSEREGFGIVYIEASACGKPVIGSTTGGATDAVEHEVTGLCIDPNSDEMLINAVTKILRDPAYARKLGDAGRRRVETTFSRQSLIHSLETLLNKRICAE